MGSGRGYKRETYDRSGKHTNIPGVEIRDEKMTGKAGMPDKDGQDEAKDKTVEGGGADTEKDEGWQRRGWKKGGDY